MVGQKEELPIKNLILMGISTGGVALSGVGWEDDIDFQIVVLKDACADPDEEVHGILVDKVTPQGRQRLPLSTPFYRPWDTLKRLNSNRT